MTANLRLVLLFLWIAALAGFVAMAVLASAHSYFPGDLWVSHRLQEVDGGAFELALDIPETLTGMPYPGAIWVVAVALLWLTRHRREAFVLLLIGVIGWTLTELVKTTVDRPRPSSALITIAEKPGELRSFPSGHTMSAMIVFGSLLYFSTALVRSFLLRLGLQSACLYAIVFTGIARIYHGGHWFSDVYGAAVLGALLLAVFISFDLALASRPDRPTSTTRSAPYPGRLS